MEMFAIWIVVIVHEGEHLVKLKLSELNLIELNVSYILMKLKNLKKCICPEPICFEPLVS